VIPFFSPPSFHTLSLSPVFTSVWWSTSPHKPQLVISHSTCPPLSSSPQTHSFVLGTTVINNVSEGRSETFIASINTETVLLRTRSKENTFYENPFYSTRDRVLCKIYKRDSGLPATSRAAQQRLSAVERCANRRAVSQDVLIVVLCLRHRST
jgi:hypothetical protein